MRTTLVQALSRALRMLAYIVLWLCLSRRAFPSNWLALGLLFVALIPVALLYQWLTVPHSKPGFTQLFFPIPKFVVIAIGAIFAFTGFVMYDSGINSVLYAEMANEHDF
jgi:hypothetical protein